MIMAKESINGIRKIAKASGYENWMSYLYDYCLNGNNLRDLCDKMNRLDVLMVIDAVVGMELECSELGYDIHLLQRMYLQAFNSLCDRL